MLTQVSVIQASMATIAAKVDQVVTINGQLVTLTGQLKAALNTAIGNGLSPADAQALTDAASQLDSLTAKLQTVAQADSDATTVNALSN